MHRGKISAIVWNNLECKLLTTREKVNSAMAKPSNYERYTIFRDIVSRTSPSD